MKKENFIRGVKVIMLGLLLGVGIGLLQASSWSAPTTTVGVYSPTNSKPPINFGTDSQSKAVDSSNAGRHGGLGLGGSLSVAAGAVFQKSVNVGSSLSVESLVVYGNKKITNSLVVSSIANSPGKKVCADSDGKLITCPVASCHGTYQGNGPLQSVCGPGSATVASFVSSYGCTNAGALCSTVPVASCTGSTSTCSSGCFLQQSYPIINKPCSDFTTQITCSSRSTCSWGF